MGALPSAVLLVSHRHHECNRERLRPCLPPGRGRPDRAQGPLSGHGQIGGRPETWSPSEVPCWSRRLITFCRDPRDGAIVVRSGVTAKLGSGEKFHSPEIGLVQTQGGFPPRRP